MICCLAVPKKMLGSRPVVASERDPAARTAIRKVGFFCFLGKIIKFLKTNLPVPARLTKFFLIHRVECGAKKCAAHLPKPSLGLKPQSQCAAFLSARGPTSCSPAQFWASRSKLCRAPEQSNQNAYGAAANRANCREWSSMQVKQIFLEWSPS